jgi:hypothetical protein
MDDETPDLATDLVRWTFTAEPEHRDAIETHLDDLGADVFVQEGGRFLVTWEEPEHALDEVVEAIWALNGTPFDVIQEEFHRLSLSLLQLQGEEEEEEEAGSDDEQGGGEDEAEVA